MATTTTGLPYPSPTDTADVPFWSQALAEAVEGKLNTNSATENAAHVMASGTAALVGTYTGQRLRMIGGYVGVNTNSSGDGGIALPTGITGILTAGTHSAGTVAYPVAAHIYKSAATTTSTISVRCYNGTAPAASTTVGLAWWALVW